MKKYAAKCFFVFLSAEFYAFLKNIYSGIEV